MIYLTAEEKRLRRRFAALLLIALFSAGLLFGGLIENVRSALGSWELERVTVAKGIVTVQTKDRQIRMPQFSTMVAAACSALEKAKGVSELRVVNFSGRYGFAFEKPSENCERVLNVPLKRLELQVATSTHTLP